MIIFINNKSDKFCQITLFIKEKWFLFFCLTVYICHVFYCFPLVSVLVVVCCAVCSHLILLKLQVTIYT